MVIARFGYVRWWVSVRFAKKRTSRPNSRKDFWPVETTNLKQTQSLGAENAPRSRTAWRTRQRPLA